MRTRPPLMLAAASVALALLAACSGGDDGDDGDAAAAEATTTTVEATTTEAGPTRDEYVASFSEVCLDIDAGLSALTDPQSYGELVDLADEAEGIVAEGVSALRALEGPAEVVAEATAAVDVLEREVAGFSTLAEAAAEQDDAAIEAVGLASAANREEARQILGGLGIDCGFDDEAGGLAEDAGTGGTSVPAAPDEPAPDEPAPEDLPPGEPAVSVVPEYGTEPQWDVWSDQCEGGLMVACDALYLEAQGGYATYGQTCGGRIPPHGPEDFCQQITFSPGR